MSLVLGKLYLKLKERARAEDCLQDIPFAQQPTEELCEFYGGVGDLYFDLQMYELAEGNYRKAISKSEDPQSLTRIHSRLEYIQVNENYRRRAWEASAQGEFEISCGYREASRLRREESSTCLKLAIIYNNLGFHYADQGEYSRAEEYYLKCLSIRQDVLHADHPDLAGIYCNLGSLYDNKGEYIRAEEYSLKCLSIWQEVLSANHPDLAMIYNNLGLLYNNQGEYSRAEEYYLKCLSIYQEVLPANHTDLARIYNNLGLLYSNQGEYTRAEEYSLKCLSIWQEILSASHPDLATIYNNLGALYDNQGEYSRAEEYYLKCLSIYQEVLPANHPDIALIYCNLGMLYDCKENYTRAEKYYRKCLNIRQEVLATDHADLIEIQNLLKRKRPRHAASSPAPVKKPKIENLEIPSLTSRSMPPSYVPVHSKETRAAVAYARRTNKKS
jgi:tetratricopeptide (TPR) repeat protein